MRSYIARQLVQLVVVVFGISVLAFAILHVLGDPVLLLLLGGFGGIMMFVLSFLLRLMRREPPAEKPESPS